MSRFRLVDAEKVNHPVALLCRVLGVSRAGYYAWRARSPSARAVADAALTETIRAIHRRSRGTYGAPRVHAELVEEHGVRCGRKRVARLMRAAGVAGCHRRRAARTTRRDAAAAPAPDLVRRAFAADAPNRLWTADITYLPTWSGIAVPSPQASYLAVTGRPPEPPRLLLTVPARGGRDRERGGSGPSGHRLTARWR